MKSEYNRKLVVMNVHENVGFFVVTPNEIPFYIHRAEGFVGGIEHATLMQEQVLGILQRRLQRRVDGRSKCYDGLNRIQESRKRLRKPEQVC